LKPTKKNINKKQNKTKKAQVIHHTKKKQKLNAKATKLEISP